MALIAVGVSGGVGAYKAAEVVRGLQKRGHDVVAILTRGAQQFVTPLTFEALTRRRGDHRSVGARHQHRRRPHLADDRGGGAGRGAGHRQPHRQARARARRRLPDHVRAGDAVPDPARAGDEHADAGAPGRRGQPGDAARRAASSSIEPGSGYLACGWIGPGRLAEPEDIVTATCDALGAGAGRRRSRRASCPDHRRADLRGHRSGALRRQSIERPDGRRAGRGGAPARRRGDARARAERRRRRRPASRSCACAARPRCTRR